MAWSLKFDKIKFYGIRKFWKTAIKICGSALSQGTYLSAKYWVATSPIGSFDKTTWAPLSWILANFSYRICHSASTIFWYSWTAKQRKQMNWRTLIQWLQHILLSYRVFSLFLIAKGKDSQLLRPKFTGEQKKGVEVDNFKLLSQEKNNQFKFSKASTKNDNCPMRGTYINSVT